MANRFPPPAALILQGNLKENWRRFEQQIRIYLSATEISKKSAEIQANTLLHVIGPDALEIYNTFTWTEQGDEKNLEKIIEKFAAYCNPKKNVAYERHVFNRRSQLSNERIDTYVTELRILAKSCEFGQLHDSLIRDRIVCGIASDSVRRRLLRETELTLEKTLDICRAAETSDNQMKTFVESKVTDSKIDAVQRKGGKKQRHGAYTDKETKQVKNCRKCGKSHAARKCPAFGQTCHECGKSNHYAKMCRSKNRNKKIHVVDSGSDTDSEFGIETVESTTERKKWSVVLNVENSPVKFKIDTGAQCNIIPRSVCDLLGIKKLQHSKARLVSYTGHKLNIVGKTHCSVQHKNKYYVLPFYVVPGKVDPILGLPSCEELNILKLVETIDEQKTAETIMNQYSDVFEGIGRLKEKHHIHVDKNIQPVVHAPRKVSYKMRSKLKEELNRMESLDVIEKVNEPSDWVNSLVIVEKPNRVRICLDPRDLNRAIKREHYPMKTVDDITHQLAGAKFFSTLDASNGFWSIVLDQDSSKLTTFNTPFGRYRYKRLPFGISSAPEVFQKRMSQIFENIEGCDVIMDDILVWGKSLQEHNERLANVLIAIRREKIKLNKAKCKLQMKEVKYMGHIFNEDGIKTCPDRIKAITEFPQPTNVKELQRFLGMVNYVGKFVQNLATITEPLRELLEKKIAWHWNERQEQSFKQLKSALISAPVLQYFDPKGEITLSVDASSSGLGACVLQNEQPVAYASRSLNKSERNYAQIEKELLAIVYACKKFHQYIYGQEIQVETDHKPLESLFRKTLSSAPPRIQRMMIKVQQYHLNVNYKPGKYLYIADTLSRATEQKADDKDRFKVYALQYLPISDSKVLELATESTKDEEILALQRVITDGWPENISQCNKYTKDYWNFREELSFDKGVVTKGRRLVVPYSMRNNMLNQLHYGHSGIEKCKARAREVVFWPGINQEIEKKVGQCKVCNKYQRRPMKQPLKPHPIPLRPWQKVGLDLFELDKKFYLVLIDYFSKFFEVCELQKTTSTGIINKLRPIFARHGIPEELMSDNAPNLVSEEFDRFCKEYGFRHTTSSPHYPQSNGMAERTVQTVKKILKKSKEDKTDPNLAFLELRNTPISDLGTPTQLLFGRRTRSIIPTHQDLLKPNFNADKIRAALTEKQNKQKYYYDRNSRELPEPKVGENVNVHDGRQPWKKAVVVKQCKEPRSYIVESEGVRYRRNQKHLSKNIEPCVPNDMPEEEIFDPPNEVLPYKTRSGRAVKVPQKFKDFVM